MKPARRFHFIAGLPRSGSTLFAALLNQNPRFRAGSTSPVGTLFASMQRLMCQDNETAAVIDNDHRRDVLRGVVENYYARVPADRLVFDTHRIWPAKLPAVVELFPDARIICCVRHVPAVFDSLERLALQEPLQVSRIFNYDTGGTVYSRAEAVCSSTGLVGFALNAVRDAFFSPFRDRIMLLDYRSLAAAPVRTLDSVYAFLGEERFDHSVDNVSIPETAYGERLGAPSLHRIRPQVAFTPRELALPPDVIARLAPLSFWRDPKMSERGVLIV